MPSKAAKSKRTPNEGKKTKGASPPQETPDDDGTIISIDGTGGESVRSLLLSEFEKFQSEVVALSKLAGDGEESAEAAAVIARYDRALTEGAARIRRNVLLVPLGGGDDGDDNGDLEEDVVSALRHVLDCAVSATADYGDVSFGGNGNGRTAARGASNNDNASSAVDALAKEMAVSSPPHAVMDLAMAVVAGSLLVPQPDDEDEEEGMAREVLAHLTGEYAVALLERVRCAALYALQRFASHYAAGLQGDSSNNGELPPSRSPSKAVLDLVSRSVVARITDKSAKVRQSAAAAASSLAGSGQDGLDDPDALTSLVYAAQHDPSSTARAFALRRCLPGGEGGGTCLASLEARIAKVRDEAAQVRVAACEGLANVEASMWDAELRATVVQSGIVQQRCAATQKACRNVVRSWIRESQYDPLDLLRRMQVSQYESQALEVCRVVLNDAFGGADEHADGFSVQMLQQGVQRAIRDAALAPPRRSGGGEGGGSDIATDVALGEVTAETLVWARAVCAFATGTPTSESTPSSDPSEPPTQQRKHLIDQVVPDISFLCQVLEHHLQSLISMEQDQQQDADEDSGESPTPRSSTSNRCSTSSSKTKEEDVLLCKCVQLLQLVPPTDAMEEGSRRHLVQFLRDVLVSLPTPEDLIEPCLQVLIQCCGASCAAAGGEAVLGAIRMLEEGRKDPANVLLGENYWVRILSIMSVVGENPKVAPTVLLHRIEENLEDDLAPNEQDAPVLSPKDLILSALRHPTSAVVRQMAVTCLGQMGLWVNDKSLVANSWCPLLLRLASSSDETPEIRSQALLALSDWAMIDVEILTKSGDVPGTSTESLEELILKHLNQNIQFNDSADEDVLGLCLAAEAAVKLMLQWHRQHQACLAWLPYLVTLFFDDKLQQQVDEEDEEALDVGSPARLQQLLSIFFPAFCLTAGGGGAVHLLESMGDAFKIAAGKKRRKAWPFSKMVAYLCDTARQFQHHGQSNDSEEKSQQDGGGGEEEGTGEPAAPAASEVPKNTGIPVSLLAAVQITGFLSQMPVNITTQRALLKIAAALPLGEEDGDEEGNISNESQRLWLKLSHQIEEMELNGLDDDETSLQALTNVRSMFPDEAWFKQGVAGETSDGEDDEQLEDDDDEETETEEEESDASDSESRSRRPRRSSSHRLSSASTATVASSDTAAADLVPPPDKENSNNREGDDDCDDPFGLRSTIQKPILQSSSRQSTESSMTEASSSRRIRQSAGRLEDSN